MRSYTIVIVPEEEGGYSVEVPALPGCYSRGDSVADAIEHAREAITGHISVLQDEGLPVPTESATPELATISV